MKTSKTLLLNLSEHQVEALSRLPCIIDELTAYDRRRIDALVRRSLARIVNPISPAAAHVVAVTDYGSAALHAYRAAEAANLLRRVR